MVAFSYSPGCDINTLHQPNADTFYTLVDIFAHLPVAVAHDVKNVSECYIVKKKKKCTHSILSWETDERHAINVHAWFEVRHACWASAFHIPHINFHTLQWQDFSLHVNTLNEQSQEVLQLQYTLNLWCGYYIYCKKPYKLIILHIAICHIKNLQL